MPFRPIPVLAAAVALGIAVAVAGPANRPHADAAQGGNRGTAERQADVPLSDVPPAFRQFFRR
jgi:hypothetical protein